MRQIATRKTTIILIAISFSLQAFGQQNSIQRPFNNWPTVVYLDSVKIELAQTHFDPAKIKSMNVVNDYIDSTRQIHGKIFIASKNPKDYIFLTITDILKIYRKDTLSQTIFMLDNNFLKDISKFKIDSSYIFSVDYLRGNEFEYLKNTLPNLTFLRIRTRTKENLEKQNKIMIR